MLTWLAAAVAFAVGTSLGVFGSGGSMLMVPLLVYGLGMTSQTAIALSLLVVSATSATALLRRGRARLVQWRTGAILGGAGMASAYAGGKLAGELPERLLLTAFSGLMLVAAVLMLRRSRSAPGSTENPCCAPPLRVGLALVLGAGIGFVSGLAGAGGGFLVVPALALFGKLDMRAAVATSLLVVTLQSLAGLVGHAHHLDLDWSLAAAAMTSAIVGAVAGSRIGDKLPHAWLQRGFAWLVGATALFLAWMQLPRAFLDAALTWASHLQAPLGGAIIGLAAALLWLFNGRVAGISGIASGLLRPERGDGLWRSLFLLGIAGGGWLMHRTLPGAFEAASAPRATMVAAGLLVGVGTTLANGCTSGHGVCGLSRLSRRSWVAVFSFMATGVATVHVVRHLFGGAS